MIDVRMMPLPTSLTESNFDVAIVLGNHELLCCCHNYYICFKHIISHSTYLVNFSATVAYSNAAALEDIPLITE